MSRHESPRLSQSSWIRIPVGILAQTEQGILFEYHSEFLECGIPLSPYFLPLRPGIFFDERQTFDGLFGVFNDSLPDGWGLLLFDRARSKKGRSLAQASPLERLTLVGSCAMGALEYEPDASADEDGTPQPWSIKFRAQEDRPAR